MTLCAAWIRGDGRSKRQLMLATDSRLTGGRIWDAAPKIVMLGRTDCAVAFAGATDDAYPLMLQAQNTIAANVTLRDRRVDLYDLKGHLLRVLNQCSVALQPMTGQARHDVRFVFGGWSWARLRFTIWQFIYTRQGFQASVIRPWRFGEHQYVFMGDNTDEARGRLFALMSERSAFENAAFDMEPLAVLRDMIASGQYPSIGGWPQTVRIYQHMNAQPFVTQWPSIDPAKETIFGRQLLGYEQTDWPRLDIDLV